MPLFFSCSQTREVFQSDREIQAFVDADEERLQRLWDVAETIWLVAGKRRWHEHQGVWLQRGAALAGRSACALVRLARRRAEGQAEWQRAASAAAAEGLRHDQQIAGQSDCGRPQEVSSIDTQQIAITFF